jgi:hypothetical protein
LKRLAAISVVTSAIVMALPGVASANGDPASDVLPVAQVFLPHEVPISKQASEGLQKTVSEANKKGYKIRVAVIAFTGDLGTARSLWGHPQSYAKFLESEITFAYDGPVLIAMPSGFGYYNARKPVAKELRVLKTVPVGKTPTPLAESAAAAVRALAAANGVNVSKPSVGGSSATRDRIILAIAVLALVLIVFVPTSWVRRRARGGAQSPSAGPR